MHVPDGILPPAVAISGYGISGGITWYCLKQIEKQNNPQAQIPRSSLLTAAFFVASSIHIPIPPISIHLILNGLVGALLGYYAFPAILIGLFFQAVMFGHGGLSTLGINGIIMGVPALFAGYLFRFRYLFKTNKKMLQNVLVFAIGCGTLLISAALFTTIVLTNISPDFNSELERNAIFISLFAYSIQAIIEGSITVAIISFLERVKPQLLEGN
ncbi:MAG: cobalt transporter CbiM [Prochloraceae cyanobacterium]|nr:cobalt transporter CbiM [Prochloraceae cyanobacterium]